MYRRQFVEGLLANDFYSIRTPNNKTNMKEQKKCKHNIGIW